MADKPQAVRVPLNFRADTTTTRGRFYAKEELERAIEAVQPKINGRCFLAYYLIDPQCYPPPIQAICGRVTKLEMEGVQPYATIVPMPYAATLFWYVEHGTFDVTTSGFGKIGPRGRVSELELTHLLLTIKNQTQGNLMLREHSNRT